MATGDPWCEVHQFAPCRCHEFRGLNMSGNFTVLTPEQEERLRKLEAFHSRICELANKSSLYEVVEIYKALSKVNPNWDETYNPKPVY